jgi:hypothetical protein
MKSITHRVSAGDIVYTCDTARHRIIVTGPAGDIRWTFGDHGKGPGRLDTPLDLAFVRPEFDLEALPEEDGDVVWLAVADYGNKRVQVFELDGVLVGSIDEELDGHRAPCALQWRAPYLDIEGVEGVRSKIHLSAALLWAVTEAAETPLVTWLRPRWQAWEQN